MQFFLFQSNLLVQKYKECHNCDENFLQIWTSMNCAFKTSKYHEILFSGLREVALTNCDSCKFNKGQKRTFNVLTVLEKQIME